MMSVLIRGISKKLRNKIKEHGETWLMRDPYQIWAELGVDFEIVEEHK